MEKSPHSYLAFSGAEEFARQQVLPPPKKQLALLLLEERVNKKDN
jgi:hypothetical protein